jgi:hypothetical protein
LHTRGEWNIIPNKIYYIFGWNHELMSQYVYFVLKDYSLFVKKTFS